jgi:hypothetical protein
MDVLKANGVCTQGTSAVELALRLCDVADPRFNDLDAIPAGKLAFYLTTGETAGVENSLGTTGAGVERLNTNACP